MPIVSVTYFLHLIMYCLHVIWCCLHPSLYPAALQHVLPAHKYCLYSLHLSTYVPSMPKYELPALNYSVLCNYFYLEPKDSLPCITYVLPALIL